MTDVATILTDAFRESNLIAAGKSPSTNQSDEALRLFNRVVTAALGNDAGELLRDWPLGNYGRQTSDELSLSGDEIANPPINARLLHVADAAITVYFPPDPSDGARMAIVDPFSRLATINVTLDANGRTIEGAATQVLNTNALSRTWLYRADLGDWVRVSTLVSTDQVPFPEDFDDMWTILLSMRLNPRNGRELADESIAILKSQKRAFTARYVQSEDLSINDDVSWPHLSTQTTYQGDVATTQFNRGR